ncbi:uncharacterized protein THITE_36773 [Thermothielavioides terrestris NRRL 8126]|uniref:DNA (cytosine-5-)-methyltransferase n=1 Tax=Thermothielavioides terrestris (strain ATCC 38088 / NRRL 8126) TaxID=578455 RepID=G2R372_THETT|nr:uncharacterized protein THITE_36773 [Thermothielavioides terrestris NRRL 8126]AEO65078.1 hypothetical protein THITE_36773 [Thermothielavioides terrestris NRRL 8126]
MTDRSRPYPLGGPCNPFVIDDDDEYEDKDDVARRNHRIEEEAQTGRRLAEWAASRSTRWATSNEVAISDLSDDFDADQHIEDILAQDISHIIDLTGDEDDPSTSSPVPSREEGREIESCVSPDGLLLRAGQAVELHSSLGNYGVRFLKIKSIVQHGPNSEIVLRGWGYARTRELDGMLPAKLNELVLVAEFRGPDPTSLEKQGLVEVPLSWVKCGRDLRVTNAPFPEHRFDPLEYSIMGKNWVEEHGTLVCRYRYEIHYHGNSEKPCEWVLGCMDEDAADPSYRLSNAQSLNRWRGGKIPGGSYNPSGSSRPVFDLESGSLSSAHTQTRNLLPDQRYTAGDVFAGAGGASRGIERAGVHLAFAVDHWPPAVESLRANFPETQVYEMDVTDFLESEFIRHVVDILHVSPPCQFWSPAHTVAGRDDDKNSAVLFASAPLIKKHRPRLFTMEQTFGLLSPKFTGFFNTMLRDIAQLGCSMRWRVAPLANYGVPQLRRRLIIIGSAPGEKLPPFPPATHSKDGAGGLKRWVTPKKVLDKLQSRRDFKLHQPQLSRRFRPPKAPWDPTKLARTITTNGGQNYHWDGERDFTLLEYALLQGFPTWHKFRGGYIKKQIGNAFAPTVVKVLYEHLKKWLLVQDGFDSEARPQVSAGLPRNTSPRDCVWLPCPGSQRSRSSRRLSEVVRRLNLVAKQEENLVDLVDLDGADELSDTATLRGDEEVQDLMDVEDSAADLVVDGGGGGTRDDPYLVWD